MEIYEIDVIDDAGMIIVLGSVGRSFPLPGRHRERSPEAPVMHCDGSLALASTTKDDVMTRPLAHTSDTITFGPFTLAAKERLLLRQGVAVDLGTRAFDILAMLAARPNQVVSKKDLLDHVW